MTNQTHQLAAIMFTDVVGYTALMDEDEEKAFRLLEKNRTIQQPIIQKYNGKWLKEMGDGVLASFSTVSDAVYCAGEIQRTCENQPDLSLRIGIHLGEVIIQNEDVFGSGVNIASRLEQRAPAGAIWISDSVHKNVANKKGIVTKFIGEETLKNVKDTVRIYEVSVEAVDFVSRTKPSVGKQKSLKKPIWIGGGTILALLVLFVAYKFATDKPRTIPIQKDLTTEKSIAVLPFDNESAEKENIYFVNGMMEDIRNHLSKIEELQVSSKTSTERYRETDLLSGEIGKELGVNYLLEGTVQKQGNQVKIHAQLIEAESDNHIWSDTYVRDIADVNEVFNIQSDIALIIASELHASITPEEKDIIEIIPTTSLTAYDFFLRAREEHTNYWRDTNDKHALDKAIVLYHRAIDQDSTYAKAYSGLTIALLEKHIMLQIPEKHMRDSVLNLANKAISLDDQLDEAFLARAKTHQETGNFHKALKDYNRALQINPNYAWAYREKGEIHLFDIKDYVQALANLHMAVRLDGSSDLAGYLRVLGNTYRWVGFNEKGNYYQREAVTLDNDSSAYFYSMAQTNAIMGKYEIAVSLYENAYEKDSSSYSNTIELMNLYTYLGKSEKAKKFALRLIDLWDDAQYYNSHRMGFAHWLAGNHDEAKRYFDRQVNFSLNSIENGDGYAGRKFAHFDLAGAYAFLGEKDKAYAYLEEVGKVNFWGSWLVDLAKTDPLFENIRDEERFQKFLHKLEANYLAEHERVKNWLEKQEMF